ncbi:MAG: glutathione S-transferase, partial [Candidatus Azotimanducaceae bacterium]
AILRYRRIPYLFLMGKEAEDTTLPKAKVGLLPTFYLPNELDGKIEAVVDSTPLIRRFEVAFEERRVIPDHPVSSFINYLIEDYGDEWLTKAMFHYRWRFQADIDKAAKILPLWRDLSMSDEKLEAMSEYVADRQISRLGVVGSNDVTADVIEDSYRRFLKIFDKILQNQSFILGERPSSADFAIYAQLTQLAKFDPTPSDICLKESPRVYGWTDVVDDLSGKEVLASDFMQPEKIKESLGEFLQEIGRVYVPALLANEKAFNEGSEEIDTVIDGKVWTQPRFAYQIKCLQNLRALYADLVDGNKSMLDEILTGSGCEKLF